ncbi:MAG: zinc ribbon domain-containing protein [Ruminococcaceae bacterium]|nr:zinc ribbon domain-containing protein [Oscillospiraceae bacterium]
MICPKCGFKGKDKALFCGKCGQRLVELNNGSEISEEQLTEENINKTHKLFKKSFSSPFFMLLIISFVGFMLFNMIYNFRNLLVLGPLWEIDYIFESGVVSLVLFSVIFIVNFVLDILLVISMVTLLTNGFSRNDKIPDFGLSLTQFAIKARMIFWWIATVFAGLILMFSFFVSMAPSTYYGDGLFNYSIFEQILDVGSNAIVIIILLILHIIIAIPLVFNMKFYIALKETVDIFKESSVCGIKYYGVRNIVMIYPIVMGILSIFVCFPAFFYDVFLGLLVLSASLPLIMTGIFFVFFNFALKKMMKKA